MLEQIRVICTFKAYVFLLELVLPKAMRLRGIETTNAYKSAQNTTIVQAPS